MPKIVVPTECLSDAELDRIAATLDRTEPAHATELRGFQVLRRDAIASVGVEHGLTPDAVMAQLLAQHLGTRRLVLDMMRAHRR